MAERNDRSLYDSYLPNRKELEEKEKADSVPSGTGDPGSYHLVDLHGLTLEQAKRALDRALRETLDLGFRNLLVIHGKGLHSSGEAVLKTGLRDYLEGHPLAGKRETPPAKLGGSGATLVRVRQKSAGEGR